MKFLIKIEAELDVEQTISKFDLASAVHNKLLSATKLNPTIIKVYDCPTKETNASRNNRN